MGQSSRSFAPLPSSLLPPSCYVPRLGLPDVDVDEERHGGERIGKGPLAGGIIGGNENQDFDKPTTMSMEQQEDCDRQKQGTMPSSPGKGGSGPALDHHWENIIPMATAAIENDEEVGDSAVEFLATQPFFQEMMLRTDDVFTVSGRTFSKKHKSRSGVFITDKMQCGDDGWIMTMAVMVILSLIIIIDLVMLCMTFTTGHRDVGARA